nr:hypothetical protein [uncultured Aminipila sp.]
MGDFEFYISKEEQIEKYNTIRNKAMELAALIDSECPDSREKSLAFNKIEEASLWANASIARNS